MTPTRFVKQREFLALGLAFVLLSAVAVLVYRSIDAAEDTLGWVKHTGRVLQQIEQVSGAFSRTAAARRSYIVGGDGSQLAEVSDLDARMNSALTTLRTSISDNPAQIQRLDRLAALLHQRITGLDAAIEDRRHGGVGGETSEGLALVDRIRGAQEEMEQEEDRLLAERDARTRVDISRTKTGLVVGTLATFAILLVAFGLLRQEIGRRRASENFLDSIVENLPNMIFVKEAGELRFVRINRAGELLLGIGRADLLGKNDYDFFPRDQADFFQGRDRDTLSGRDVMDIPEESIATKQGERWLHTRKVPVFNENGRPQFLLGISEDITERRKVAIALREAKDAAEAANKELEAFSYSVAHDLRSPLRAIDGFSQALEEDCADKLDADGKDYLHRVRASAKQMSQLIDGLLGLSRVSRGDLAREKVDLTKLAEQTTARLRDGSPERRVEVVIEQGLTAEGDARLLGAALDNLLGNAWKFTSKREQARIEVGKNVEDGRTVFFVRDNGAGFDQAFASKLFGAFQRLHGAHEFEGTGIGLATVQRIVRRHGGRIWAEGAVGKGATLYFTL